MTDLLPQVKQKIQELTQYLKDNQITKDTIEGLAFIDFIGLVLSREVYKPMRINHLRVFMTEYPQWLEAYTDTNITSSELQELTNKIISHMESYLYPYLIEM